MPPQNEEFCEAGKKKTNSGDRGVEQTFIIFFVLHQLKKHVLLVKIKNKNKNKKARCLMNSSTDIDCISIFLKT